MNNKARFITLTDNGMKYTYNTSKTSCRVQAYNAEMAVSKYKGDK